MSSRNLILFDSKARGESFGLFELGHQCIITAVDSAANLNYETGL
jgi:hypothetical protein